MIARRQARITARLELTASLSQREPKPQVARKELDIEEGVLQSGQARKAQRLSGMKDTPTP